MAGLKCAEVLLERDIQVTILEGRDRIGGRVRSLMHQRDAGLRGARSIKVITWVTW